MQPINPFLRAFFRSALPSQCSPIHHHVLLVPTTDVLLNARDRESNTPYAELAATEDFLASHVLRVPGGTPPTAGAGGKESGNVRENKGKAKQYITINGRTVIVKDAFVYSNKGFKSLNQAQLLHDAIYYPPDTNDGQQWLVYYISRPLIGSFQYHSITSAVISDEPSKERRRTLAEASGSTTSPESSEKTQRKKKEVKNFSDLMNQYPMIARQMQVGLEKAMREFVSANDAPIPKRSSRRSSLSSQRSSPSLNESITSLRSSLSGSSTFVPVTAMELEPQEESLRTSLETAITASIEFFQNVDKAQLSLLGSNTELTGRGVERMIERYVTEQLHDQTLFPRLCALRKSEDGDLEVKIRKMADIDIAQVGIPFEGGMKGKRELAARLHKGVEVFRKMGVSSSPQETLEILLDTQKVITATEPAANAREAEKSSPLTVNADILVSMLLIVVIRSGVRHLISRLLYMRYFIFADEVENGEQGYALATLEAVLAHLSSNAATLRMISRRNRALWQATRGGDVQVLEALLQPRFESDLEAFEDLPGDISGFSEDSDVSISLQNRSGVGLQQEARRSDFANANESLGHVFPFQRPPTPPPEQMELKIKKRVSMASLPRSQSASSGRSSRSHSRNMSVDSSTHTTGDLSAERLAQTQDADGNSLLMMAVDATQSSALRFLLSMPAHFRTDFVLSDVNNEGTTLLTAAVCTGSRALVADLIDYLEDNLSEYQIQHYLATQDTQGRCVAHYLFHQPHLIQRFGKKLPWRLKDKNGQTPLFALCRSYDHEQYFNMVDSALSLATETQNDNEPLHLDDHVDAKGNTLLHIVNDPPLTAKLLRRCDSDVNAMNDKRFTPLMVGSKYGRIDLVRTLFGDARVDMTLRDIRGLTAVELAKDDDVRNRIDDLVLLSTPAGPDGRSTVVTRSFFVEDATIRLVLKSGAGNPNGTITVTTCRRSIADFENLAKLLSIECPASWIPTSFNLPSPFLIPSKPSRALLRDIQLRLDSFFRNLLTHGTFRVHELVWEFFLVPDLDSHMLEERSKRKAEARVENVREDFEPVMDTQEVENFVAYARDQIKGVTSATKKMIRSANRNRMLCNDIAEAQTLAHARFASLLFLPAHHVTAFYRYTKTFVPSEASPMATLYYSLHAIHSSSTALQLALNRPAYLIGSMSQAQRSIDRSLSSISRSNRWTPNIGLFEDTKKAVAKEAWDKAAKARNELETLGCELRYTQQTVASELAAWQDEHVAQGRRMLKKFVTETLVKERVKLDALKRALRVLKDGTDDPKLIEEHSHP